jgi:hypothetical protein
MADPRLEQERILPRLQRILDVVSSWADRTPAARPQNVPDVDDWNDVDSLEAAQAAMKAVAGASTGAAVEAMPRTLAGVSPALAGGADSEADADTDRAHGGAAGTGRRHARATEPIWHMITGQDARLPPPGLRRAGTEPAEPGGPGDLARAASGAPAPGTPASARPGESMTTAVGMGHMSGIRTARSAIGAGVAVTGPDAVSDQIGNAPGAARDAAAPGQDAAVLQPLLGQDTPPLFGRAGAIGRAATASDTGAHATRAPGPNSTSGTAGTAGAAAVSAGVPGTITGVPGTPAGAPGAAPPPWRATSHAAEPTPVPGHMSTLTGPAPGSLLQPPDLLGAGERPARPTPRSVTAEPQPHGPGAPPAGADAAGAGDLAAGAASGAADGAADLNFRRSELEEEIADVLEHAAREAGVDLS